MGVCKIRLDRPDVAEACARFQHAFLYHHHGLGRVFNTPHDTEVESEEGKLYSIWCGCSRSVVMLR